MNPFVPGGVGVRLGVYPCDLPLIGQAFGAAFQVQIREDCPPRRAVVRCPVRVEPYAVTKQEFLRFFFTAVDNGARFPDADIRHWEELGRQRSYLPDAPIVGVGLLEAMAYAYSRGGRILRETEYEYLLRGRSRCGFVGSRFSLAAEPKLFDEVVRELLPVDADELPRTSHGVVGLFGNARELVMSDDLDSAAIFPVVKPLGRRDRFLHAGARILEPEGYLRYITGGVRMRNIEPPGFRVAYDVHESHPSSDSRSTLKLPGSGGSLLREAN